MAQQLQFDQNLKDIVDNPVEQTIDFSQIEKLVISTKDIYKCVLTGQFQKTHRLPHCNIVLSRIDSLSTNTADFGYIDFKDSFITNTSFSKTSFDYGAIINCRFTNVQFTASHFKNVSITGTKFFDTVFWDCDLTHMVIESCEFHNCKFTRCKTSNKLIELSLIDNCTFNETNIQIETITHNFGVEYNNLQNSAIRDDLEIADYKIITKEELVQQLNLNGKFTEIEKFRISFFLEPDILIEGGDSLDDTFKVDNWIKLCQIPTTLINLLELYHNFIVNYYNHNKALFLLLLKLHDLTNKLQIEFEDEPEIYQKVIGIHMSLSRLIEPFLLLTMRTVQSVRNEVVLLVQGPIEKEFYLSKLDFIFSCFDLTIIKVKKHNSPNELFIEWGQYKDILPLIALFFATRIRIEFSKLLIIQEQISGEITMPEDIKLEALPEKETKQLKAFTFELGPDRDKKNLFGLRMKTIFPGNLLFDIGLHLNTKVLSSSRKIILAILGKEELTKLG